MNFLVLTGRLTNDPEVRYTKTSNTPVTIFNLATRGEKDTTIFFNNISAWGKTGEVVSKYCKKGTLITLLGRLHVREYIKGDVKIPDYKEIVAEKIEFGGSKKENTTTTQTEFTPISEDDMPF